jgi:hypothetical protein
VPVITEYIDTGFVGRFPTAFGAASLVVVAFIVLVVGILLDGLRKVRQETTRIAYMTIPALPRVPRRPGGESGREAAASGATRTAPRPEAYASPGKAADPAVPPEAPSARRASERV